MKIYEKTVKRLSGKEDGITDGVLQYWVGGQQICI